jgi:beta-phosphoglucomutase-like phosphatase (HAD superfamily)
VHGHFRGAILDVDGVLVDTPHERAWRDTLEELMDTQWSDIRGETSYSPQRFTSDVYRESIAGKPRMSGARAALDRFHVPDAGKRAEVYAQRKQQKVVALIEAGEFTAFDDALRFALALRAAGIRLAAASSSKNAALVLGKVRLGPGLTLLAALDADVSGRDLAHGKPHPEIFLVAARELGLPPRECFVVEDAVSGIEAAKAGAMAALGVARAGDADLLTGAGADLVVTSLDDVDVDRLSHGRLVGGAAR